MTSNPLGRYTLEADSLQGLTGLNMSSTIYRLIGISIVWACGAAVAQGQVLQLPTFDYFSVRTAVMVPDSGGAFLGGIGRTTQRSRTNGLGRGPLLSNRMIESSGGASLASVHATIIDHEEMDRAVRGAARRAAPSAEERRAAAASFRMQPSGDEAGGGGSLVSVAEARRRSAERKAASKAEAENMFADGQAAETRGELGTARIFYQMAHKRAEGDLRQAIHARIAALPDGKKKKPLKPVDHTVK